FQGRLHHATLRRARAGYRRGSTRARAKELPAGNASFRVSRGARRALATHAPALRFDVARVGSRKKQGMTVYEIEHLWRRDGWISPAFVAVDASGYINSVGQSPPGVASERVTGYALPGIGNVHSHAFQRAFAGLAEQREGGEDSFWSWR